MPVEPAGAATLDKMQALNQPSVSVIVLTYRRQRHALAVLDQLVVQTAQPDEVQLIDSSPAEECIDAETIARYPRWLHYSVSEAPDGNVSRLRNQAVVRSRGQLILFLDDDVTFGPTLIADYLDAMSSTGADAVGGIVLLPGESPGPNPRRKNRHFIDDPGAPNLQPYDGITPSYVVCTASLCARRPALLAVGGFDENMWRLEDVELGLRMTEAGMRVMHHNGPVLRHLVVPASGARSENRGMEWMMESLFYFQLRHFPHRPPPLLLSVTLWEFCRPSRHWLTPSLIARRARMVLEGYRRARQRAADAPRLIR